jgi:hypothetical protein
MFLTAYVSTMVLLPNGIAETKNIEWQRVPFAKGSVLANNQLNLHHEKMGYLRDRWNDADAPFLLLNPTDLGAVRG